MLQRQPLKEIGLAYGLNTKGDERAQPEQLLDLATNVEFDDVGGLRCRYPFDPVRTDIVGGGTIANARKLAMLGDELLCFTIDTLYSYSWQLQKWVSKGAHLAIKTDEVPRFVTTGDQVDCDRAEMSGVIVYAWTEGTSSYVAALDKVSGTVVCPPTVIADASGTVTRPRLVALSTRIMLLYHNGTDGSPVSLRARPLDPAAVATSLAAAATTILSTPNFGSFYDACQIIGTDTCAIVARRATTTSYSVFTLTAGAVLTSSTKARTAATTLAIASNAAGTRLQIVRMASATAITGDLLDASSLADVFINQAIGTTSANPPVQIAAAFRSVTTGGQFRCYVFWSSGDIPDVTTSNFIDDANAVGTQAVFANTVGVASRAFDYNGSVYLWAGFAESTSTYSFGYQFSLQNTYFLYRDDATLAGAKACTDAAGGAGSQSHLPGVALTSGSTGFSWCGIRKRRILLGAADARGSGYAARSPQDITFTFDSNEARRTVQFGQALYVTGGEIKQYDGRQLTEVGFHIYPWSFVGVLLGAGGSLSAGGYAWKMTWRWQNAAGEVERSTTATVETGTAVATDKARFGNIRPLCVTHKLTPPPEVEVWRTLVNPSASSPFFKVSSQDPAAISNPNRNLVNDPTAPTTFPTFDDSAADTAVRGLEANPENNGVLEALAPPPASIIAATENRIFLAGISGFPNQIQYSKLRTIGQVASFNDALTLDVPSDGGAITALGVLDGALIVWCETATYAYGGSGFDNAGSGTNYQLARTLSKSLGCVGSEACALGDDGFFVKTSKGWFLLDRALNYAYIGAGVDAFDSETVLATLVLTKRHQVRILTTARMLVFDTLVKQWAQTSVSDGLDLVLSNGQPAYLTATGPRVELATWDGYAGTDASLTVIDVETGWAKFGAMQARAIVDHVQLLGELRSACVIRKRLAKDYEAASPGVWNYTTDVTWTPSPGVLGSALQVRQSPRWKRCESIKARFTVTHPDGVSPLGGPCVRFTSIAMLFALEPNTYGALGSAQKQ